MDRAQPMQICPQCPNKSSWVKWIVIIFIVYFVISGIVVLVIGVLLSSAISKAAKAEADAQKNFKPENILFSGGTITIPLISKTESGTLAIKYDNAIDENGDGVQDEKGIVFTVTNTKATVPPIKGTLGFGISTSDADQSGAIDGSYNYVFVNGSLNELTSKPKIMYRSYPDYWLSSGESQYAVNGNLQAIISAPWNTNTKTQAAINIDDGKAGSTGFFILAPSLDTGKTTNITGKFTHGVGGTTGTQVNWFSIV